MEWQPRHLSRLDTVENVHTSDGRSCQKLVQIPYWPWCHLPSPKMVANQAPEDALSRQNPQDRHCVDGLARGFHFITLNRHCCFAKEKTIGIKPLRLHCSCGQRHYGGESTSHRLLSCWVRGQSSQSPLVWSLPQSRIEASNNRAARIYELEKSCCSNTCREFLQSLKAGLHHCRLSCHSVRCKKTWFCNCRPFTLA